MGLTTAYFLKHTHKVTVIEPDSHVKGASEKNAGTLTVALPPWTTRNPMVTVKDNLNFYRRMVYGIDSMFCLVKPTMIFDADFRSWVKWHFKSKTQEKIDRQTRGIADVFFYGYERYDAMANDITNGDPDKVDFHTDTLVELFCWPDRKTCEA